MSIDRDARSRRSRRDPPHERHRSAAGAHPRSEARIRRLTARQEAFLADSANLETPFLLLDLDVVGERYRALRAALPGADVYYAVKANPAVQVIDLLARLGCRFDVASPGEIRRCTEIGVPASALSYGNTVKRERDVADAGGVRRFTVDAASRTYTVPSWTWRSTFSNSAAASTVKRRTPTRAASATSRSRFTVLP